MFELLSGILKHFPGIHTRLYSKIQEMEDFVVESIERHREMLDPSAPKDFIDSFLVRMDKARAELDGGGGVGNRVMGTLLTLN